MEFDYGGLNNAQLNATIESQIDGYFNYDPPMGQVLKPGHHILHACFTPSDSTHFEAVNMSVNLHIKRISPILLWEPPKSSIIVAEKAPPEEIFNAICKDDIKGRFDYTYKYVLKENTLNADESSYSSDKESVILLKRSGVGNSDNYKYDCVMTVSFQPDAKYASVYANSRKTIAVPSIGTIPKLNDIYPRDRVTTLYPYGDRFYSNEYRKQP